MSTAATATVNIQKLQKNHPGGWSTALCTDVCLPTTIDQTQVIIPPADSQSFTFYFYTDNIAASGNVQVGFSNPNNNNNKKKQGFYASTSSLGLNVIYQKEEEELFIFPNPAYDVINVFSVKQQEINRIELYDLQGKLTRVFTIQGIGTALNLKDVQGGPYLMRVQVGDVIKSMKILIL
jgi:hypothetical protein